MSLQLYLGYLVACVALVILPGPTVTMIIANSLRHGMRAGLLIILGTQIGQLVVFCVLMFGLKWVMDFMGTWFDWIRLAGALYLAWIGIAMLRSPATELHADAEAGRPDPYSFVLTGLGIALTNPKSLLFLCAFVPQFIEMSRPYVPQLAVLMLTFMATAFVGDAAYAAVAGSAGMLVIGRRRQILNRVCGTILIAGAIWLVTLRR
jgi:homoserine/homoserine lactone efflux protein